MQAVLVSCMKVSCESLLESLVSTFENHFDARRTMNEDSTSEEFMIVVNGPNLSHCDNLVKEAMDTYWRSNGSSLVKEAMDSYWGSKGSSLVKEAMDSY